MLSRVDKDVKQANYNPFVYLVCAQTLYVLLIFSVITSDSVLIIHHLLEL